MGDSRKNNRPTSAPPVKKEKPKLADEKSIPHSKSDESNNESLVIIGSLPKPTYQRTAKPSTFTTKGTTITKLEAEMSASANSVNILPGAANSETGEPTEPSIPASPKITSIKIPALALHGFTLGSNASNINQSNNATVPSMFGQKTITNKNLPQQLPRDSKGNIIEDLDSDFDENFDIDSENDNDKNADDSLKP